MATPSRMPVRSTRPESAAPAPGLPDWYTSQISGWTPVAVEIIQHLARICTAAEMQLVLAIVQRTIGDYQKGRPEWAVISYDDFREEGVELTDRAIANALLALSDGQTDDETGEVLIEGKRLIEVRTRGRGRAYRILYQNFPAAKKRERAKSEKLAVVAAPGQRALLSVGQPVSIAPPTPARTIEIVRRTNGELPLEMETAVHGDVVKVSLFLPVVHRAKPTPRRLNSTSDVSAGQAGEVQAKLGPIIQRNYLKPLDLQFAKKIAARLGGAPVEMLIARIDLRKPKNTNLILLLADDVRVVWEECRKQGRPREPECLHCADSGMYCEDYSQPDAVERPCLHCARGESRAAQA